MLNPSRQPVPRTFWIGRQLVVAMTLIVALIGLAGQPDWQGTLPVTAAEPPLATSPDEKAETVAEPALPPRVTEKQIKAYSGLAALAGIVIAGLGLTTLTILWAGRLRRQLRKPLPEIDSPVRDFWFLKPPKPTVRESSLPDAHQPPHVAPPDEP